MMLLKVKGYEEARHYYITCYKERLGCNLYSWLQQPPATMLTGDHWQLYWRVLQTS